MLESHANKISLAETLKATATDLSLIDFSNKTKDIEIIIKKISLTNSKLIYHLR